MGSSARTWLHFLTEKKGQTTQRQSNTNEVEAIVESHYEGFATNYIIDESDRLIVSSHRITSSTDENQWLSILLLFAPTSRSTPFLLEE